MTDNLDSIGYNALSRMDTDDVDPYAVYVRKEGVTLEQYVELLLRQGKRSQDEDFKTLMRVYGRQKIIDMAKAILEREKLNG